MIYLFQIFGKFTLKYAIKLEIGVIAKPDLRLCMATYMLIVLVLKRSVCVAFGYVWGNEQVLGSRLLLCYMIVRVKTIPAAALPTSLHYVLLQC